MALQYQFICLLQNGIHARPAGALEEVARGFASEIVLSNQRTGRDANGKSVLSILSADIGHNDHCVLVIDGSDEQEAMTAMAVFVNEKLPHCDDTLMKSPALNGELLLPVGLRNAKVKFYRGMPVVSGVGQGAVVHFGGFKIPATVSAVRITDNSDVEWRRLDEGLKKLAASYDQRLAGARTQIEIELLKAHRAIARDPEFSKRLHDAVRKRQLAAASAIAAAEEQFTQMLAASTSRLLRERAVDIQDVCSQLLQQIYGDTVGVTQPRLDAAAIVIAPSLTPSQFLSLDRTFLKGLVLGQASATSHTVILARSFNIPTLIGVGDLAGNVVEGAEAVIDADLGALITNLTKTSRRYYAMEQQRVLERQQNIRQFAVRPASTWDGHRIEIVANITCVDETQTVFDAGAEGIGLFRTEMLFFDRGSGPDETEQFEAYSRVLKAAAGRPVVIRTVDFGGDKPLDYLKLPAEKNPFLGYRAVRIYPEFESLFRTQARALIRASVHGPLQMMIPMIATPGEVHWVKRIIAEEQARCRTEGVPFDKAMPVGAMIEVPAAAFALDSLCRHLDFFSIGTNDLLQYFMAADRANIRVGELYNPLQPAFLRLLKQIVDGIHAHKKWVELCGEIGGQLHWLPLLVGLGLDKISVAAPAIASLKAELAELKFSDCRRLLDTALNCTTAGEVAALLDKKTSRHQRPLLDPKLVVISSDAATKEEVIKEAVDRLYVLGRADDSRVVEEAIWQREAKSSTGFGHAFAIPHCKSSAVKSSSLVLLKLREPVAWDSLDGQSVRVVFLLAVREINKANEHMKIFAKLAQRMLNENFRARVEQETDADALYGFLQKSLQVDARVRPEGNGEIVVPGGAF
jgi:fructose-specific PTS system IIA-like component